MNNEIIKRVISTENDTYSGIFNITPTNWLNNYLEKRSLSSFNLSKPLYSYQTNLDEYQSLKLVVIQFNPKSKLGIKHREWCACFVLFCSEWYRRLYQSDDGWSWQGVWDELGFVKDANDREKIVLDGLEVYWKRPILRYTQSRNFLGSVFAEGGLPFKLISDNNNQFGHLMLRTLKNFYQVDLFRISLQDVIRRNVESLPVAFQQEESIELIAEIINQLMQLVKVYSLDNLHQEKPSEYLDKVFTGWRANFPIPLDNVTGTDLLDNWLSNATKVSVVIKKHKPLLACHHYLTLSDLSFRTEITLPNSLQFNFKKTEVNSARIDLDIHEGDKSVAYLGGSYAHFESTFTTVRPRLKGIKLKRLNIDKSLRLVTSDGGKYLEGKYIENSAIQLGEVPLGFDESNNLFRLIGQASFSTKKETIYLLLPINFKIEVIVGICELESTFHDFNWYKVSGDLRCISEDSVYRISTNKSIDTNGMISLSGNEVMWGTKPSIVYKGIPKFEINSDALVSKYGFTSFIDNENINSLLESQKYGRHTFSIKNKDNDILLRRNVGILPEDFYISFKPGKTSGEGLIMVTSNQKAIYSLVGENVIITSNKLSNGIEFLLSANGFPPVNVSLYVTPNLLSDPIQIDLPFPASGIFAFKRDNEQLPIDVSVEDLIGSRLYLYCSGLYSEVFNIELALLPTGRSTPYYSWDVRVDDKPIEINLYSYKDRINELMSLGTLDAVVKLTVKGKGGNSKSFNIRRHSHSIEIDFELGTVALKGEASLSNMFDDSFKPMAMLISEPERNPIILEPKLIGESKVGLFDIPSLMNKEGPWLIVPHVDSEVTFRAGFYSNNEKYELEEINSIKHAVEQFRFDRTKTISNFLNDIQNSPENHNWNYFIKLWEKYNHLPLSTFNAWRDLIKNHKAMALLLLKMEMDEHLIQRIDREFTIIWEMIPPSSWIEAKHYFAEYLNSLGLSEAMCTTILNGLFDKLRIALPSYPDEVIEYIKTEKIPKLMPVSVMKEVVIAGWTQSLMQENSEADWPNRFEGRLIKWLNKNPEIKYFLNIPNNYQYPVAILPIVCASIAAENTRIHDLFVFDSETLFNIKLIRDFDHNWFNPVYSFFLNYFLSEKS